MKNTPVFTAAHNRAGLTLPSSLDNMPHAYIRQPTTLTMMHIFLLLFLLLFGFGCASNTTVTQTPGASRYTMYDEITVEGEVSVRGHEPFTAIMLETNQNNVYVLKLDEEMQQQLPSRLPARYRITGILTADTWQGRTYAHLQPTSLEPLSPIP